MAKKDNRFYRYYRKHRIICSWLIAGGLLVFSVVLQLALGKLKLTGNKPLVGAPGVAAGTYRLDGFTWAVIAVLTVLLVFAIMFMAQNRSDAAQERNRREREEAVLLRREVMDARQKDRQHSYEEMKRRRAERLAARGAARGRDGSETPPDGRPAE